MTSRREFLQIGIAASALPVAAQTVRTANVTVAAGDRLDSLPLYKALYDIRFADSVAFARRIEALGVPVHAIEGDMTRFWYDDLYHRWRKGSPAAIAGLTGHGALFCLERLAWDQRMRVVFRAEHKFDAVRRVAHDFSGPTSMLRAAKAAAAGSEWSAQMADVVTQCPSGRTALAEAQASTSMSFAAVPDAESLFSWVIAPAIRV